MSGTLTSVRDLRCALCGVAFTCGAGGRDGGCWCCDEDYRVPMPVTTAEDCLCPSCLREHAKKLGAKTLDATRSIGAHA